jgi:hypothetical protein
MKVNENVYAIGGYTNLSGSSTILQGAEEVYANRVGKAWNIS